MKTIPVLLLLGGAAACATQSSGVAPRELGGPDAAASYRYTVNPDVVQLFAEGRVPFGAVFYLGGTPSALNPGSKSEPAFVGFEFDGIQARAHIARGDTLLSIATRIERAFASRGVACSIHEGGSMILCVSPDGTQVEEWGAESMDQDLSVGSDLLKY